MASNRSIHFHILEDIARDLSGDINFPTCLDAALLVRNALKDPFASTDQVVQAISIEPLICSKLLRLANSVSYNPAGEQISNLNNVVRRLGFDIVRTTSLAVAMDQMLKSKNLAAYDHIARQTWEHSLRVAAIARVLAGHLGRVPPDNAMLTGLVHNIGIFYLLFRAAEYPEYRNDEPAMIELLAGWHEGIGESLLHILGLPASITDAVRDQSHLSSVESPCTISDILYFAIVLAGNGLPWQNSTHDAEEEARREADRARYADLLQTAEEDIVELRAALSA
ncbi:HDOD domain-containing protein [Ferribacterium limneticum]|uniref:HDOD domain-containing protein n=1 Tax=Ferribacterium limneticum TaxID=76259 RepID=UPI001CF9F035|nr:HDOD domain-containing protein [Ferribacterium limneticum]UCV18404.1 HDOD domain-containing protein [Ferribacterium limneticum]